MLDASTSFLLFQCNLNHPAIIIRKGIIAITTIPLFYDDNSCQNYSARKVKRLNSVTVKPSLSAFNTSATVCFGSMMLS